MLTIYENMIGRMMKSVVGKIGDEEIVFTATDGCEFKFYHAQDCCESVYLEGIAGDLEDLVGSPIIEAEEVSYEPQPTTAAEGDYSLTWTFYKFATVKGFVCLRFYGESNGYYSECASYEEKLI